DVRNATRDVPDTVLDVGNAAPDALPQPFYPLTPRFFTPSMSTSVITAPSILLSPVRYGRMRSDHQRPALSRTSLSQVVRVSTTLRINSARSGTSMFGLMSLSRRPTSVGIKLNAFSA